MPEKAPHDNRALVEAWLDACAQKVKLAFEQRHPDFIEKMAAQLPPSGARELVLRWLEKCSSIARVALAQESPDFSRFLAARDGRPEPAEPTMPREEDRSRLAAWFELWKTDVPEAVRRWDEECSGHWDILYRHAYAAAESEMKECLLVAIVGALEMRYLGLAEDSMRRKMASEQLLALSYAVEHVLGHLYRLASSELGMPWVARPPFVLQLLQRKRLSRATTSLDFQDRQEWLEQNPGGGLLPLLGTGSGDHS